MVILPRIYVPNEISAIVYYWTSWEQSFIAYTIYSEQMVYHWIYRNIDKIINGFTFIIIKIMWITRNLCGKDRRQLSNQVIWKWSGSDISEWSQTAWQVCCWRNMSITLCRLFKYTFFFYLFKFYSFFYCTIKIRGTTWYVGIIIRSQYIIFGQCILLKYR